MNDRDCDNCAHHSDGGCSVWECSFERKENDMIYRQDTIDAMEGVDWYHINKGGQLTHGANSKEDEPLYKAKDMYKVLNHMPPAQRTQTDTCNSLKALDCVERQAAIDAANDWLLDCLKIQKQDRSCGLIRRLEDLPSAQPEPHEIGYSECANSMLKMWMDNVLTDGEYSRIMDKLHSYWAERREG